VNTLNEALSYANKGIRVIPIQPGTKHPGINNWTTQATTNPTTIRQWWTGPYKGWGVGIVTGRATNKQFFVLDIDEHDPQQSGHDTLADLETEHGKLPETITVLTPTGGKHLYYSTPIPIRNDAGRRLGPGLDIRGDGGQVLAPPTIHPNGQPYTFEHGYSIQEHPLAEAPEWLIQRLTTEPTVDNHRPRDTDLFLTDPNSPSARYNNQTTWNQLLTTDGWTYVYSGKDGTEYWRRPGKTQGISASVNHNGNDALIIFTTNAPIPPGGYSRFGYYAATQHGGSWKHAAAAYTQTNPTPTTHTPDELLNQLINWQDFWKQDHTTEDWLAYPLIARSRQTALFAVSKMGKSYLTLATVAALATGRSILGRPPQPPINVLYLDYEMVQADLYERLEALGYTEDDDLTHLHYALLPNLPPLNTYQGAAELTKLAELVQAQVVVIDTTGRAIEGEENSADTYREYARTTGLALKTKGIAVLRTDHAGKDKGKTQGQRGSSAKNDDVDIVYRMDREAHTITLTRIFTRIGWCPAEVTLHEDPDDPTTPIKLHEPMETFPADVYDLARTLCHTIPGLRPGHKPPGRPTIRKALKEAGIKARNDKLSKALRAIELGRLRDPLAD
jgi:hypothetical protein